MPFLLTNVVQNVLSKLGQVDNTSLFTATGGSATTFVAGTSSSGFGLLENQPETDFFKNYLTIIVRDAGGAGASPEGKWSICSGYVDTTWTGTIATVTDAIASGDTVMLARQDAFPIEQIVFAVNRALENLGDLPLNADTSLTTVANQTEYSIPVAVKRGLKQVWVQGITGQSSNNQWRQVHDRRNELTGGGSASILYLPQYPVPRTIRLIYDGAHPVVSTYSDAINQYVHPKVVTFSAIIELLQWYNRQDANQDNSYFLALEQDYTSRLLPMALLENPIQKEKRTPKYSVFGNDNGITFPPLPYS